MAAHRYWRARFEAGSALSLSEFQLLTGATRVDAGATLTSSVAPATGSLANLKDDDVTTDAVWPAAGAVVLVWDFGGSPADVNDIRLGSTLSRVAFPALIFMDWSDDNTSWTLIDVFGLLTWPGFRAKTASEQLGNLVHAIPYAPPGGGSSPIIVAGTTADVYDNNGVVLAPRNGFAGAVVQLEAGRAALVGGGISIALGLATRRAMQVHTAGQTTVSNSTQAWQYRNDGQKQVGTTVSAYGASWTALSDVVGMTYNTTTGAITFYKNGVSQGVAFTIAPADFPDLTFWVQASGSAGAASRATSYIRTRGFTYPITGAVAWEDRTRIVSSMPITKTAAGFIGRVNTQAERTVFQAKALKAPHRLARDFNDPIFGRGIGRIRGKTLDYATPSDLPYRCLVRLLRESDGAQIREVWSAADGSYDFQNLDELQSYTVLAYYLGHGKQAVAGDGITLANGKLELMP